MYIGTRGPEPQGRTLPLIVSSALRYIAPLSLLKYIPARSTVDFPARLPSLVNAGTAGGGTWSKRPSFSSNVRKNTVLLHTSGFTVSASNTWCVKSPPRAGLDGAPGCSDCRRDGSTQDTCGNVSLRTCSVRSCSDQWVMPFL